mmetsp:Transcript_32136/g.84919  ORF Transcript_32136/g.84919 Transcript_32136/m.84919 type:complete len:436 (+) Transcript_32136:74-1381(+)
MDSPWAATDDNTSPQLNDFMMPEPSAETSKKKKKKKDKTRHGLDPPEDSGQVDIRDLGVPEDSSMREYRPSELGIADPAAEERRSNPLERGFSFSLTDLPNAPWALEAARRRAAFPSSQHPSAAGDFASKWKGVWNPLESINRHWGQDLGSSYASSAVGSSSVPFDLTPRVASPPAAGLSGALRAAAARGGSVEEELYRREARASELRQSIALLEAAAAAEEVATATYSSQSAMAQAIRIMVPAPLSGERMLGIVVQDLVVCSVDDPRASSCGWLPGDRIRCVNGQPVGSDAALADALALALRSHRATGAAMAFDVWRPAGHSPGPVLQPPAPQPPSAPLRAASPPPKIPAKTPPKTPPLQRRIRCCCGEEDEDDTELEVKVHTGSPFTDFSVPAVTPREFWVAEPGLPSPVAGGIGSPGFDGTPSWLGSPMAMA